MKLESKLLDSGQERSSHGASLLPAWISAALKEPHPSYGAENVADFHDEQS